MPRPPHVCACGHVVAHGARCICQVNRDSERNRRFDATRPSAHGRGYSREWRRARTLFLDRHPDCALCGYPATVVDHIIPHRGDDDMFWNRSNWQPLCKPCHDRHKQREERADHV